MNDSFIEAIEDEEYSEALALLEKGADPNALIYGEDSIILTVSENDSFAPGDEDFDLLIRLILKLAESGAKLDVENYEGMGLISLWFHANIPIDVIRKLISLGAKFENSKRDELYGSLIGLSYALMSLDDPGYVIDGLNMLHDSGARLAPNDLGIMLVEFFVNAQQDMSYQEEEDAGKFIPFAAVALEMGANIDAQGIGGHTAVMRSSMNVFPKIVDFLLSKGADTNIQSDDGNSALMFVSGLLAETSDRGDTWLNSDRQLDVAKILLQHGADKSLSNKDNQTALHIAKKHNNIKLVDMLNT